MASDQQYNNPFSYCYNASLIVSPGAWVLNRHNNDPGLSRTIKYYSYAFPTMLWQLCLTTTLCQVLGLILRPTRLPRVVSEILAGIILGPSVMGQLGDFKYLKFIFPRSSILRITMLGDMGMFFFLFLVGVQCNVRIIGRLGKKVFLVATSNLVVPLLAGIVACKLLGVRPDEDSGTNLYAFYFYVSIIPCVTAFPVLARLVADLKFLNTEMGRLALYSSIITDLFTWIAVSMVAITPAETREESSFDDVDTTNKPIKKALFFILLSGCAFILVCWFVIRPTFNWLQRRLPAGEQTSDRQLGLVITIAIASGALLDAIGFHALFGGFIIGLMVPKGMIADALVSRLETFAAGVLLPIYFYTIGSDVDVMMSTMIGDQNGNVKKAIAVFIIVTLVKLGGNVLVAHFFSMRMIQGLCLGLLMCAKGQIELIILRVGNETGAYSLVLYTVLVFATLITTMICIPAVILVSRVNQGRFGYRRRNLQTMRSDAELRVLTCIHTIRNVPGILSLLQFSQSVKRSPMFVGFLHLIEHVSRSAATIIIQENEVGNIATGGNILMDSTQSGNQFNRAVAAFRSLEQNVDGITVQPLTAISPYSTMHTDICNIAEENFITLIILPFHKLKTASGSMTVPIPAAREVNINILEHAQCSVGILVDRGIGGMMWFGNNGGRNNNHEIHQVAILFFGGPNDREALSFGHRLAGHPNITLTLVRFVSKHGVTDQHNSLSKERSKGMTIISEDEMEKRLNDRCITNFRLNTVSDETVIYTEINVQNSEDTIRELRKMSECHDTYIVGRTQNDNSPLFSGMTDWMEFPELGCIGDFLLSSDFGALASIFVLQNHSKSNIH